MGDILSIDTYNLRYISYTIILMKGGYEMMKIKYLKNTRLIKINIKNAFRFNRLNYFNRLYTYDKCFDEINPNCDISLSQAPISYNPGISVRGSSRTLTMVTRTTTRVTWPMLVATTTITLTMLVLSTSTSGTIRTTRTRIIPAVSCALKPIQINSLLSDLPRILKAIATFVESLSHSCCQSSTFSNWSSITRKTGIIDAV